jgi:hypothetical protein
VGVVEPEVGSAAADTGAPAGLLAVALALGFDACGVLPTTGAAALAVGTAVGTVVDLTGAGD